MIEQVAENIYRIPVALPGNPLKELNSYLIRDPARSILIDTGFRSEVCRAQLLEGLAALSCRPEEVDIVLTHLHSDHTGLAPELAGENRQIYISAVDRAWIEDAEARWQKALLSYREAGMPENILRNIQNNPAVAFAPPPGCKQYVSLHDGDLIQAGGYQLRCILTPGHTPGHMCLWDAERRLMFTGDHVLFDITPNITTWTGVEDSLGDYLQSLRNIQNYPVQQALPGHRECGDFADRIRQLLEHHNRRIAEAAAVIRACPGSSACEIAGQMHWSIRARNWEEFPENQKFFAVGECMAHLDYLRRRGQIVRRRRDGVFRYELAD